MKKILGAIAVIALVAFGVVAAPLAASANGTVTGTITDSSAVGINNAVIEFKYQGSTNFYYTDPSGNFTADVPNGTYTVYIHATGYAPEYYNDSFARSGAAVVTIEQGSNQTINASLSAASVITGHITDFANGPVDGQVFAESSNDPTANWFRALTNPATGEYTIEDLSPGTYRIWVSTSDSDDLVNEWYDNKYEIADATPVVISAAGTSTTVDVQLQKGGEVSGTIENTIGSPVDLTVLFTGSHGQIGEEGDAYLGEYEVHGVLPDTYTAIAHDYSGFFQDATNGPFAVSATTPATADFVVTPAFPDESEFYPSPVISGPSTVQAGKTYTWTVNVFGDSDAYAILYSDPVFLGAATQNQNGVATLTLTIPASTPAGSHKLTWSSYDTEGFGGDSRQYFAITVTAADAPALAATGLDASVTIGWAALLLAAGAALMARRRFIQR